ncbi:hypothetical protein BBO99_00007660 [Phytophthora kernoviae]|uniref:Uncharacterized protein n=2 Tax=Phytophthora kernoviae TaxID=325452 RepID=A0A3R7JT05_9STRA|nr:hypothetical protein G195_009799 [Phytophthora kernoviae 00238/432]KAG2511730.1 hypothetical protein JM16_008148 [Phytophthora kernoviae]KAG2515753.1 hypothetical protein JM18_008115 [Phytophthora kernoviae]RLN10740.1 hypothetical protein BBI17_007180 [Phytophthora kernoviae]RLN76307.1 hypothetical protein BBO99_00007660 [Phytophthora kernoviae]
MSKEKTPIPQAAAASRERKSTGPWRGTKSPGFILQPELFMKECIGMDVSVRVMNGAMWKGVLAEVKDNGSVVIRPAQEMLYGEKDGPERAEQELVKSDILWLRRHPKPGDVLVGVPGRGPPAPEHQQVQGSRPDPEEEPASSSTEKNSKEP